MPSENGQHIGFEELIFDTTRSYICDKCPQLMDEFERYIAVYSLESESTTVKGRDASFAFELGLMEAGAAVILGIVSNLLTGLLKNLKKRSADSVDKRITKIPLQELRKRARTCPPNTVRRIKRRIVKRTGRNDLVEEVVDYTLRRWKGD